MSIDMELQTTTVLDEAPVKTPYEIAVDAIVAETSFTPEQAAVGIDFIQDMVNRARGGERCNTPGTHHLTWTQMESPGYEVMDEIMPHGSTAVPDSAHAAVETVVLGSDEFAVVHDNPTGQRSDCVVTVSVRQVG